MTVQQANAIDFIAHDPKVDEVLLVMVEDRPWGSSGQLLPELQAKLNAYLGYVTDGRLSTDYPNMAGKRVHFQLRATEAPGPSELDFLKLVNDQHLAPQHIRFSWRVIGEPAEHGV